MEGRKGSGGGGGWGGGGVKNILYIDLTPSILHINCGFSDCRMNSYVGDTFYSNTKICVSADNGSYYVGENGTLYANGTNLTYVPVSPAEEYWK